MSVHVASKNKKKEMMKSYVLNGYHQSFLKKHLQKTLKQNQFFFPEKKEMFFEKLSTSEMKNLLHPSEISVKC